MILPRVVLSSVGRHSSVQSVGCDSCVAPAILVSKPVFNMDQAQLLQLLQPIEEVVANAMAGQLRQTVGAVAEGNQAFLNGLAAQRREEMELEHRAQHAAQEQLVQVVVAQGAAQAVEIARTLQEASRIAEVKLPDFKADGSLTYSAWFTRVEALTADFGARRVPRVLAAIQGRALDVLTARGLLDGLREGGWEEVTRHLRRIFEPRESFAQREERFRKLRYDVAGGLDGYITKFLTLLSERDCSTVPHADKMRYFIMGLTYATDAGVRYVVGSIGRGRLMHSQHTVSTQSA